MPFVADLQPGHQNGLALLIIIARDDNDADQGGCIKMIALLGCNNEQATIRGHHHRRATKVSFPTFITDRHNIHDELFRVFIRF